MLGDDPARIASGHVLDNDNISDSETHTDNRRPMIEMAHVSSLHPDALSASQPVHNHFSTNNVSFEDAVRTNTASPHARLRAEVDLLGATGHIVSNSPSKSKSTHENEHPRESTSNRHALDGVIIVGNDGVPMCMEDGMARSMSIMDVPDEQDVENMAFLKQLGLARERNPTQQGGVKGIVFVGEHNHLRPSQTQARPSYSDTTVPASTSWFSSPKQSDELPLMSNINAAPSNSRY